MSEDAEAEAPSEGDNTEIMIIPINLNNEMRENDLGGVTISSRKEG